MPSSATGYAGVAVTVDTKTRFTAKTDGTDETTTDESMSVFKCRPDPLLYAYFSGFSPRVIASKTRLPPSPSPGVMMTVTYPIIMMTMTMMARTRVRFPSSQILRK